MSPFWSAEEKGGKENEEAIAKTMGHVHVLSSAYEAFDGGDEPFSFVLVASASHSTSARRERTQACGARKSGGPMHDLVLELSACKRPTTKFRYQCSTSPTGSAPHPGSGFAHAMLERIWYEMVLRLLCGHREANPDLGIASPPALPPRGRSISPSLVTLVSLTTHRKCQIRFLSLFKLTH